MEVISHLVKPRDPTPAQTFDGLPWSRRFSTELALASTLAFPPNETSLGNVSSTGEAYR
jgi:hypothetical protein